MYVSIYLFIFLSIYISIYLAICVCVYLCRYVPICLSVSIHHYDFHLTSHSFIQSFSQSFSHVSVDMTSTLFCLSLLFHVVIKVETKSKRCKVSGVRCSALRSYLCYLLISCNHSLPPLGVTRNLDYLSR